MQVTSDVKIGGYCIVVLGQFKSGLALFYVYLLFCVVHLHRSFYIEVYTERSS